MADLLLVRPYRIQRRNALFAEFVVEPDLAPFLVSSTRGFLWVDRVSTNRRIRAAFRRDVARENYYRGVVAAVITEGDRRGWGNVHPLTSKGLQAAMDHLSYYDLLPVDVLVGETVDPRVCENQEHTKVSWLGDEVVVVPRDRAFLGFLGEDPSGISIVVVHNASRGMAVLR